MRRSLFVIPLFFGLLLLSYTATSNSSGAPAGHTGAPNESTCARSGCHNSFVLNSGEGTTTITVGNGATEYVPDSTYEITVRVAFTGRVRFGFELTAYANSQQAGSFALLDASNTRLRTGVGSQQYVTHTSAGTMSSSPGEVTYRLSWTAPSAGTGPATLYAAGNATNNNGSDGGDFVYTTSLTLQEADAPTSLDAVLGSALSLFPNPAQEGFTLKAPGFIQGPAILRYIDLKGRSLHSQPTLLAQGSAYIQRPVSLPPGTYLVRLEQDGRHWQQKLFLR